MDLEEFGSKRGESAAFDFGEGHVAVDRLAFEFIDEVGQARGGRVEIRIVDLVGISRHDNLGSLAHA